MYMFMYVCMCVFVGAKSQFPVSSSVALHLIYYIERVSNHFIHRLEREGVHRKDSQSEVLSRTDLSDPSITHWIIDICHHAQLFRIHYFLFDLYLS